MPGVFRNSLKPFGMVRQKCIDMLEEIGIQVETCNPATGYWRTSIYADVYRWEFTGTIDGVTVCGGCWETMTKCAKSGGLIWNPKEGEVWPVPPESGERARSKAERRSVLRKAPIKKEFQ